MERSQSWAVLRNLFHPCIGWPPPSPELTHFPSTTHAIFWTDPRVVLPHPPFSTWPHWICADRVGKWHLGLSSRRFTPLGRGFQTYMGYLGGAEDYWLHGDRDALDFFDGAMPEFNFTCWDGNLCPMEKYSANIFAARASKVIATAAKGDKPMFLYLAWQSVHSGDGHGPTLQAPQSYIDSFNATVSEPNRKILAGMIKSLDEGVRNVTEALKEAGIFNDTLIIFSTDNGGPADYFDGNMASNVGGRPAPRSARGCMTASGCNPSSGLGRFCSQRNRRPSVPCLRLIHVPSAPQNPSGHFAAPSAHCLKAVSAASGLFPVRVCILRRPDRFSRERCTSAISYPVC